mgnify:CR=1 FL=1
MVRNTKKIKFKILTTIIMAFALLLSPVATLVNNMNIAYADDVVITDVDGDTIELIGFKSEVKFNNEYKLPIIKEGIEQLDYADFIAREGYSYKVFQNIPRKELANTNNNAEGKTLGIHENENNEWVFIALTTGTYTLEITKQVGGKIITAIQNKSYGNKKDNGLTIDVISQSYTVLLPENSKHVVPEKMPLLTDRIEVAIPRPTVLTNKGEKIAEADYANLEVRINNDIVTVENVGEGDENDYVYLYTPSSIGTYKISYHYKVSGKILGSGYQNIEVVPESSYKLEDLKLKVNFTGSIEERIKLGLEASLPPAYAVDQDGQKINAYIKITAEHITADNQRTDCTAQINQKDFTITPTLIGNYWIYYQAIHPLFNVSSDKFQPINNSDSQHRVEVYDEELPEILYVNDYEINAENKITSVGGVSVQGKTENEILELLGDKIASVPNLVIIPEGDTSLILEDIIPAIYAKDNFTTGYENFEFTRQVRVDTQPTKNLFVINGGVESEDETYENYESASFKFMAPTGTVETRKYTFIYTAKDKQYSISTTRNFTINVIREEDYKDYNTDPSLIFTVDEDELYADSVLTFAKPTVLDENVNYKDKNIDVDIVARIVGLNDIKYLTGLELEEMFNKTTNLYEIDFAKLKDEIGEIVSATVSVYARNDYYNQVINPGFDIYNVPTEESGLLPKMVKQEITVLATGDQDAPQFAFVDGGAGNSLGDALYLANTDEILNNYPDLTAPWNYLDNGYIQLDGVEKDIFFPRNIITLPTVSATDADKNIKHSLFIFNNGNRAYLLKDGNPTLDKFYDIANDEYTLTISGAKFEASVSGLYEIVYQFEDGLGNITTKTFGIRVGEPEEPAMVITNFPKTAELGKEFIYPKITLSNGVIIDSKTWTVALTSTPDGYLNFDESEKSFKPNVEGDYRIEYKWGSKSENETTYFILNVSDTIAPEISTVFENGYFETNQFKHTIEWENTLENPNPTLKVYLPMYTVTDENKNLDENNLIAKVTVKNKAGTIITAQPNYEQGYYWFELKTYDTNQGKYSVEYTAEDRAHNQAVQFADHKITLYIGNCNNPNVVWMDGKEDAIPTKVKLGEEWMLPLDKMIIVDQDADKLGDTHEALMQKFKTKSGTVKLTGPNGKEIVNNYEIETGVWGWDFDQVGDYKLSLTVYDNANNTWQQTYIINVPSAQADEDKNISNTVGTILIILSIAVLSGVIIYFLFSNKRLSRVEPTKKDNKK